MEEWRGAPVVRKMKETFEAQMQTLSARGVTPTLAVLRVGAREDDLAYERGISKRFASVGATVAVTELPETVTQEALEAALDALNEDAAVHGILVFRPLPKHLSEERLSERIAPEKDVDCLGRISTAFVFAGDERAYPPCTPQAVMEMLDFYGVDLTGKKAVVIGRSMVVGKPLAMLLLKKHATVTVCHTRTQNLAEECRRADVLVACAGAKRMVGADFVRPGQVVLDVGIHADGDSLCGDVDAAAVADTVAALTPVPGGVGTVTTSVLLKHTLLAALRPFGGSPRG